MTRKDYERAAESIRLSGSSESEKKLLTLAFSDFFREDNPRFDRDRFKEACQDKPKKKK
jgi:hypothetical protein